MPEQNVEKMWLTGFESGQLANAGVDIYHGAGGVIEHIIAVRVAAAKAEVLRAVADDIARCADAGWTAGQIATALNSRAIQAEPPSSNPPGSSGAEGNHG